MRELLAAEELAEFCVSLTESRVPATSLSATKRLLLDYCGVSMRGAAEASGKAIGSWISELEGAEAHGRSTVIGGPSGVAPDRAAMANGSSAHSLELDDIHPEAAIHPGAPVLSAALAAGEWVDAPGLDVLVAAVVGYEVSCRIARACASGASSPRFHSTATCGVFGAAAAVGHILRLSSNQFVSAFGIAGSQAAGSLQFLTDGTWAKRLHAGWAAQSGFHAAMLASHGFTGPRSIFEGPRGFYRSYADVTDPNLQAFPPAADFQILHVAIKPYAACRHSQAAVESTLALVNDHGARADSIRQIVVHLFSAGWSTVADPASVKRRPQTTVDAQFSIYYAIAAAILFGKLGPKEYGPEIIRSSEMRGLMDRIECITAPELDQNFPTHWPAVVEVIMNTDERLYNRVDVLLGDPERPLSDAELHGKFRELTADCIDHDQATAIIDAVENIDQHPISDLMTLLASVSSPRTPGDSRETPDFPRGRQIPARDALDGP
ncbi:MAG TPA: MmgE/PrpD family protein [Arthrobacter sp.]|nr:MmgE/PrpD family protein [Arthrobacter sp.]